MNRYRALLQEKADLVTEGKAIFEQAEADGRPLTDEEKTRDDQIQARIEALGEDLAREERRRERERNAPAVPAAEMRISEIRDLAQDKPWGYDTFHMSAEEFGRVRPEQTALYRDAALGEFLQAVAHAGSPGGHIDTRLYGAASGANVAVPSEGGFLVGKDQTYGLLEAGMQSSMLAGYCQTIPISANSDGLEAPMIDETSRANGSRWGGVRVYRRAEADSVTATKPKLRNFELRLEDMMALAYATDRLLRDSVQLGRIFTAAFASEFGFKVDDEIIRGSGVAECMGLLNASATVSQAKETGQAAATVVHENISKMWSRLWVRSRGRAVWLFNQDVEPQLDALYVAAAVGALEQRVVSYDAQGVLRIKGRPAMAIEQCETLGTVGDFILADLSQYVLITKGGIQADESMHVRFVYGERAFRWMYPINGAPKWSSALTPYKGSASTTVSPFVTLATRG
jgi:HK97 family phage major capsid protein